MIHQVIQMFKSKIILSLCLAIIFFTQNSFAQNSKVQDSKVQNSKILSLEEYLNQVKGQSLSYAAANESAEAFEKLKAKAKLVTAVTFFASAQNSFVEQNQALQIVRYNKVFNRNSQVGFSQTADFGLSTKLYYSLNHVTYKDLNTANYPNPSLSSSNYQSIPTIEVSLPIWQNLFGAQTRASKDSIYFTNESQKLAAKSVSISSLVAAEQSYWSLAAARKIVTIQKNALKSAEQILDYVRKRERMNLGETGDVLQAKALLESRKLSLKQAENNEKLAARDFNKQRYIDSNEVADRLSDFDYSSLKTMIVPKVKAADRLDVKAYEANMKAAIANAKIDEESAKPAVSLFGSYSQNQIEPTAEDALANSLNKKGTAGMIGVRLSMPINFGITSDIKQGALQSASAAKLNYRQKMFEQENDWQNMVQNLSVYKENLKLSQAIEAAQKSKLEYERRLLKQGRTTTYQILLFEQDFSNSQITTIQLAYQMLALIAEEKLYNVEAK